jgi:CelD/BcsL family acetyltransferase involved in cellulose biosynthesis
MRLTEQVGGRRSNHLADQKLEHAVHLLSDISVAEPVELRQAAPAMRQVGTGPMSIDVVASAAALDGLAPDWLRLQELAGAPCVFQGFAQIRTWARHFIAGGRGSPRLHVAVVGDPIGQYADLLVDPSCDGDKAFDAALGSVAQAGADAIVLRRVRSDSQIARLAAHRLRPGTGHDAAPYADLTPYASYDEYLLSLSKNMRKGLRNRRHHLEKVDNARFELLEGGPAARQAVAEALGLKRRWMIQRGAVSTAFLDPATKECLLDLAEDSLRAGAVVMRLMVGDEPAAIRLGFEYCGTYFAYMSAYDEAFAHVAPGKMLMDFYISGFKQRGIQRVDMLPPLDRHKTDWCRGQTEVADFNLPLTRTGRAYAELYQERFRPALRRAWGNLPDGVRSLVAALLVHI